MQRVILKAIVFQGNPARWLFYTSMYQYFACREFVELANPSLRSVCYVIYKVVYNRPLKQRSMSMSVRSANSTPRDRSPLLRQGRCQATPIFLIRDSVPVRARDKAKSADRGEASHDPDREVVMKDSV